MPQSEVTWIPVPSTCRCHIQRSHGVSVPTTCRCRIQRTHGCQYPALAGAAVRGHMSASTQLLQVPHSKVPWVPGPSFCRCHICRSPGCQYPALAGAAVRGHIGCQHWTWKHVTLGGTTIKSMRCVVDHSLRRLHVHSHRSLIRLLHIACFAHALRCAHSLARSLTHSRRSSWE